MPPVSLFILRTIKKEDVMKKTAVLAVLVVGFLFVVFLAGCNTWRGFGKDVGTAGNAIENSGE